MNLARDLYETNNLINSFKSKKRDFLIKNPRSNYQSIDDIDLTCKELYNLFKINGHLTVDIIKNLSDLLICYSNLQRTELKYDPKIVSFLGITSSILAILPIVKYSYRLSP